MKVMQCDSHTANDWAEMMGGQVYLLVGSGSQKKYEPVTITGEVGDWTLTYQNGWSHKIGWNWTFYVVY